MKRNKAMHGTRRSSVLKKENNTSNDESNKEENCLILISDNRWKLGTMLGGKRSERVLQGTVN